MTSKQQINIRRYLDDTWYTDLSLNDAGNIFKIIAEELSENVNTQVIIDVNILKKFERNGSEYNVYMHNWLDDFEVSEWYTLHEKYAYSPIISNLGTKLFGHNYEQLTRFCFRDYNFSNETHRNGEYIYFEHEIQRILVIEVA